jgi:hypothetical protein
MLVVMWLELILSWISVCTVARHLMLGTVLPEFTQYIATDTKGQQVQVLKVQL